MNWGVMANQTAPLQGEQCKYSVGDCYIHDAENPFLNVSFVITFSLTIQWISYKFFKMLTPCTFFTTIYDTLTFNFATIWYKTW